MAPFRTPIFRHSLVCRRPARSCRALGGVADGADRRPGAVGRADQTASTIPRIRRTFRGHRSILAVSKTGTFRPTALGLLKSPEVSADPPAPGPCKHPARPVSERAARRAAPRRQFEGVLKEKGPIVQNAGLSDKTCGCRGFTLHHRRLWRRTAMSAIKPATPNSPVVGSSVLSSPSRRRFLIGGATIAAAACLPTAATGAPLE